MVAVVSEGELVLAGFSGEELRHLGQLRCLQEQRWEVTRSFWLVLTRGVVEEQEDEELEPQA